MINLCGSEIRLVWKRRKISAFIFAVVILLFGRKLGMFSTLAILIKFFQVCLFYFAAGITFKAVQIIVRKKFPKMLEFGYMLLVMLIAATISIAENSRTHEGLVPSSTRQRVPIGQEALDLIS